MGTNYYRIPLEEEVENKKFELEEAVREMSITPSSIGGGFDTSGETSWDIHTPWDKFIENINVHIGNRSSGWKFVWNFQDNIYFSNKKELLIFLRAGRIIDEYNEEIDTEEFIKMALDWGEPDGFIYNQDYVNNIEGSNFYSESNKANFDLEIDGLRVSVSKDFC